MSDHISSACVMNHALMCYISWGITELQLVYRDIVQGIEMGKRVMAQRRTHGPRTNIHTGNGPLYSTLMTGNFATGPRKGDKEAKK